MLINAREHNLLAGQTVLGYLRSIGFSQPVSWPVSIQHPPWFLVYFLVPWLEIMLYGIAKSPEFRFLPCCPKMMDGDLEI